jgi:hypothetical protein
MSVDPATLKRYKSVLAAFMSFLHERLPGNAYQPDHVFTVAELTAVIPLDVCRYLRLKAHSAEFPSPDMNPIRSQHNTIAMDKKVISLDAQSRQVECNKNRREPNTEQGCDRFVESSEEEGSAEAGCKITDTRSDDRKGI